MYKFTGNFAPVNQIRNMKINQETDTSGASSMNFNLKENKSKIGIFPGSFRPPHKGHFAAAQDLASRNYITEVNVIISPKERDGITADKSLEIWNLYLIRRL